MRERKEEGGQVVWRLIAAGGGGAQLFLWSPVGGKLFRCMSRL